MTSPAQANSDKIQSVISDNLFPDVQHVSDVKQVLEWMQNVSQAVSVEQIRAAILLITLGNNKRLHDKNPYDWIVKKIIGNSNDDAAWRKAAAPTQVYLDTLKELIPKPSKPVIVTGDKMEGKK